MKITVFGTGYVGLVTGTCFAELGNDVICVDINKKRIENLKKGILPIYEPGLQELLLRNSKNNRLNFSTDSKSGIDFGDIIINAVGTPSGKNGEADLSQVMAVAEDVGKFINRYKIYINKSTVPVGTMDICKALIKKNIKIRKENIKFDVASNPEFLREGSGIKDTLTPDRVIVGLESDQGKKIIEDLYMPIIRTGHPLILTDIKSAEIIKYASNAFLATKISFINEIASFCEKTGGNIQEIAKGMGLDSRIGPRFLHAGIGYGGSCLPKDVKALIKTGKKFGYEFNIIQATEKVNIIQKTIIIRKLKKEILNLKNKKIAIWGLSFKPKTDDIRDAPSLTTISSLLKNGASIQVFDPIAMDNTKKIFPKISYSKTAYEAVKNADALIIMTEWDEFRSIDFKKVKKLMAKHIIIDGRNMYNKDEMIKLGFNYIQVGN